MRSATRWRRWLGLVSLCGLVTLPQSLRADDQAPACLAVAACWPTGDDLWPGEGLPLRPAVSVPLEDPIASACRYVGFQAEWVASKRDAGLPLGEVVRTAQRVFAGDTPWLYALAGALGTLVYHEPQRSPAALRQALEAACLAPPLLWTAGCAAW